MPRRGKETPAIELEFREAQEVALRESQQINQAILDAVPARIFWKDKNLVYLGCNAAFARDAGFSDPEEVVGKDDYEMGWKRDQAELYRSDDRQVIETGSSKLLIEESQTTPDGEVEILTSKVPLRRRNGEIFGVLGTYVDVTGRARLMRVKDEIIFTVNHEFRTPLTAIVGSLGLVTGGAAGKLPDAAAHLVAVAHTNSQSLATLVDNITAIQKIDSGSIVLDLGRVEVRSLVEQVIEANRDFAEGCHVRVRLDPASAAVDVRADPDRLTQVVTNLLLNAIKFSPPGEEVLVAVESQRGTVRVSVRDHGPGIPDEFKPRLFRRFEQADPTDARTTSGAGLGLYIVKQIVDRLDGQVNCEDAPGGGTIFHVELPTWAHAVKAQSHLDRISDRRILLCEDDPEVAVTLGERLLQEGFLVDIAYTASEAIAHVAAATYTALLVDLQRPEGVDIDLIKHLRKQPQIYNTLLVALSTDLKQPDNEQRPSTLLNILDWLDTPLDLSQLEHVLDRPMAHSESPRPRVLYVDSNRKMHRAIAKALSAKVELMSVGSIDRARRAIAANRFDIAVLDVALALGSGGDLLHELRCSEGDTIPLILFSPRDAPQYGAQLRDDLLNRAGRSTVSSSS